MSRQSFELNGRQYDALTGAVMSRQPASPQQHSNQQPAIGVSRIQVKPSFRTVGVSSLDGVMSTPSQSRRVSPAQAAPSAPVQQLRTSSASRHMSPHSPQPTKTLVRRAVKQPGFAAAGPSASATVASQPAVQKMTARPMRGVAPSVIPKLSSSAVDPRRSAMAKSADRSQSIRRFGATPSVQPSWNGTSATSVSGIALAPAAVAATKPQQPQSAAAVTPAAARSHNAFSRPTRRPYTTPTAAPAKPANNDEDDQDIFTRALAEASSHEQASPTNVKKRRSGKHLKRALGIAASAAVFLGLAGFIGFQNRDDIRLQLASAKAGFPASAPLYKPDGYALSGMKYATGSVASVYRHQSQDFTITQKKSNWDSQTLLENFVATANSDYRGFQSNGRTVYVFGKGNATWVNGGIWYQIKATGNLSDDQLVRIAASM